jgi:hypothetical protein
MTLTPQPPVPKLPKRAKRNKVFQSPSPALEALEEGLNSNLKIKLKTQNSKLKPLPSGGITAI